MAVKMTHVGQPCRDCGIPVIKVNRKKNRVIRKWYFPTMLFCRKCDKRYAVYTEKVLAGKSRGKRIPI